MTSGSGALGPRAARVFYNVADAWRDDADAGRDAVAELAAIGLGDRELHRIARMLWWIEWSPRLALRSRSGFSWLPRAARRAWLDRLGARGPRRWRDAIGELRELVARLTPC
jgi:hypothetical protein